MTESIWLWVGFNVFVLAMLALDLGVFHRKAHVVSLKESLTWTFVWIGLALIFNLGVWHYFALAGVMDKFHYLKVGLGVVLSFVGMKMILAHTAWKIDTLVSLGVIVAILTTSVVWSLVKPKKAKIPVDGGAGIPLPAAARIDATARTE